MSSPKVIVLMATYNGASFLDEQLASIAAQQSVEVDLLVSDDGSSDTTVAILESWRGRWQGQFGIVSGPQQGFSENFRFLALSAQSQADYFAFSDQDDIWDADKLIAAISALGAEPAGRPALYFSRTRLIDAAGQPAGFSPLFTRPPSFRNAIVQSIGGGNTMVLNRSAFALFAESARRTSFVTHDWWAYILCSGAGGYVCYDPVSHIGYRQHSANLIGKNTGARARLGRLRHVFKGQFARWIDQNLAGLQECSDLLTPDANAVIAALRQVRGARGFNALWSLLASGVYRQTPGGNLGLAAAATLGKL